MLALWATKLWHFVRYMRRNNMVYSTRHGPRRFSSAIWDRTNRKQLLWDSRVTSLLVRDNFVPFCALLMIITFNYRMFHSSTFEYQEYSCNEQYHVSILFYSLARWVERIFLEKKKTKCDFVFWIRCGVHRIASNINSRKSVVNVRRIQWLRHDTRHISLVIDQQNENTFFASSIRCSEILLRTFDSTILDRMTGFR